MSADRLPGTRTGARPGRRRSRPYRDAIEYDSPHETTRVGVIVPFDFGLDWEYWRYLPADVELHFTRTPYLDKPVGIQLARAVARPTAIVQAARSLQIIQPAVTVYACSSGSFVQGIAGEREIRRLILGAGAPHAVTSAGAMVDALHAVGGARVALASPYDTRLTHRLVDFLEEAGFAIPRVRHLGLTHDIRHVGKRTIADLVRASTHPDADAVFVSCTSLRTQGIVAGLEKEIGRPILTANQVTLWAALAAAEALPDDPHSEVRGWVLGGGDPMAESTEQLLWAAAEDEWDPATSPAEDPAEDVTA